MWANAGSPGPKFSAGMPAEDSWATSVQPCFARKGALVLSISVRNSGWSVSTDPAGAEIGDLDPVGGGTHLVKTGDRPLVGPIRGESIVDIHHELPGDDVPGHATMRRGHRHHLQELETVDDVWLRFQRPDEGEERARLRDGVLPQPGPCRVRWLADEDDVGIDHALTSRLDRPISGLQNNRCRRSPQPRRFVEDTGELIAGQGPFLTGVENADHLLRAEGLDEMDHHRQAALHVGRTETGQPVSFDPRPAVALERHRVEMPDQQHRPVARLPDNQGVGDHLLWHALEASGNRVTETRPPRR